MSKELDNVMKRVMDEHPELYRKAMHELNGSSLGSQSIINPNPYPFPFPERNPSLDPLCILGGLYFLYKLIKIIWGYMTGDDKPSLEDIIVYLKNHKS